MIHVEFTKMTRILWEPHEPETILDWWIINLGPSYTVSGNFGGRLSHVPETK